MIGCDHGTSYDQSGADSLTPRRRRFFISGYIQKGLLYIMSATDVKISVLVSSPKELGRTQLKSHFASQQRVANVFLLHEKTSVFFWNVQKYSFISGFFFFQIFLLFQIFERARLISWWGGDGNTTSNCVWPYWTWIVSHQRSCTASAALLI